MPARRGDTCLTKLGWVLLSILLPPLAVLLNVGRCNKDVVINILLTILAWLPGTIHAIYVCCIQRPTETDYPPLLPA